MSSHTHPRLPVGELCTVSSLVQVPEGVFSTMRARIVREPASSVWCCIDARTPRPISTGSGPRRSDES